MKGKPLQADWKKCRGAKKVTDFEEQEYCGMEGTTTTVGGETYEACHIDIGEVSSPKSEDIKADCSKAVDYQVHPRLRRFRQLPS